MRLNVLLLPAFTLHVSLELVGKLLNLTLIHREHVLEFIEHLEFLKFWLQFINHSSENVDCAGNFGID